MTIIKKKVTSAPMKFVKYSELKPGATVVIGEYLGSPMVPNFDGDAEVPQHRFKTDDGLVALNSAGQLNNLLSNVSVGDTIEVIFLGKESVTLKGGKKVKINQFEVSILEQEAA